MRASVARAWALAAATLTSSCQHARNSPLVPTPSEVALGHFLDGTPILPAPEQPGQPGKPGLQWGHLDGTEVFAPGGPNPNDVIQGSLVGDCTYLAALASLAVERPQDLMDRVQLAGISEAGARIYKVQLFDAQGRPAIVYVDDLVLLGPSGSHPNDVTPTDSATGLYTTWAILWQKAAAKVWRSYAFMPHNERQSLWTLTGHRAMYAPLADMAAKTLARADGVLDRVGRGHVTTADSPPNATWMSQHKVHPSLGQVGSNGEFAQAWIDGELYEVVTRHEYSVLSATASTVTLRNPWGNQVGGDINGHWTLPRTVFYILFSGLNEEALP